MKNWQKASILCLSWGWIWGYVVYLLDPQGIDWWILILLPSMLLGIWSSKKWPADF